MLFSLISFVCAMLIGFAAHRASLCNVRAVAELMSSGSAHMLWSLVQAVMWMLALTGVLVVAFGLLPQPAVVRSPLAWALAGGLLFGVGAAVNGGCSLSTLHRLADGELGMLATLAGVVVGVSSWPVWLATGWPAELSSVPSPWLRWPSFAPWLLALLIGWVALRLGDFGRLSRDSNGGSLVHVLLTPRYPLPVAAAVMGLAAGLLYATQGAWSYTNFLRTGVLHQVIRTESPTLWHALLVAGLLLGMLGSSLQRGAWAWRVPHRAGAWARHAVGGALMGVGAAALPGGNDTLLLSGLPALTAAALGGYLAMLSGIALALWGMRAARFPMPEVACSSSGCSESGPPLTDGPHA